MRKAESSKQVKHNKMRRGAPTWIFSHQFEIHQHNGHNQDKGCQPQLRGGIHIWTEVKGETVKPSGFYYCILLILLCR